MNRAPASISVSSVRLSDDTTMTKQAIALYTVSVKWCDGGEWAVDRRFSEFVALREVLAECIQGLPSLPGKTLIRKSSPAFLEKRRGALDKFLQDVAQRPAVYSCREFGAFIMARQNLGAEIDNHLPTEAEACIEEVRFLFAYTDFKYDPLSNVVFTTCQDSNAASRMQSRLHKWTSTKAKQASRKIQDMVSSEEAAKEQAKNEEDNSTMLPVGSFSIWGASANGGYSKLSTALYDDEATAVAWNRDTRMAAVGLSTGQIVLYSVDNEYVNVKLAQVIEDAHTGRVTALEFASKNLLVSTSADGTFSVFDVSAGTAKKQSSVKIGSPLTGVQVDVERDFVFFTCANKTIKIFTVSGEPKCVHTLEGHKQAVSCADYNKADGYLFSGASDGVCGIWTVPQKVGRTRSAGWLKGGPQKGVTAVRWLHGFHKRVAVAFDKGHVGIWNTSEKGDLWHVIRGKKKAPIGAMQWHAPNRTLVTAEHNFIRFYKLPEEAVEKAKAAQGGSGVAAAAAAAEEHKIEEHDDVVADDEDEDIF